MTPRQLCQWLVALESHTLGLSAQYTGRSAVERQGLPCLIWPCDTPDSLKSMPGNVHYPHFSFLEGLFQF